MFQFDLDESIIQKFDERRMNKIKEIDQDKDDSFIVFGW